MAMKMGQPWIDAAKVDSLVQLEPLVLTVGLMVAAVIVYKLFLRGVSDERHRNLRRHFKNLALHFTFATAIFGAYFGSFILFPENTDIVSRVQGYLGLVCITWWAIVFIKTSRILLFEYLFISHMRVGVPLLLVNLFTLLLTILIGGWLLTELFNVRLAPLLATSAIFSVVLGLALQDTLGNLFSGVAMTFDKPYEIGDWIEITLNGQKWVGQVQEMSWRATVLQGLSDESISVPNRLMGQTQIANFSTRTRPICRSQLFRVAHGASIPKVKTILKEAASGVPSILRNPAPVIYASESNESFITVKVVYFIEDYGKQFTIGDAVITAGNEALQKAGFELAPQRILVVNGSPAFDNELAETGQGRNHV